MSLSSECSHSYVKNRNAYVSYEYVWNPWKVMNYRHVWNYCNVWNPIWFPIKAHVGGIREDSRRIRSLDTHMLYYWSLTSGFTDLRCSSRKRTYAHLCISSYSCMNACLCACVSGLSSSRFLD